MGKQLVENVLSKFSYLKKKPRKTVAERRKEDKENRNKIHASQSDVEKERRQKEDKENKKKIYASQSHVEKK